MQYRPTFVVERAATLSPSPGKLAAEPTMRQRLSRSGRSRLRHAAPGQRAHRRADRIRAAPQ